MLSMDPKALPLRDIHLPAPISWWPPAVGWWLVLLSILVVSAMAWWWWRNRTRGHSLDVRQAALSHLQALRHRYDQDEDAHALASELSALLRRICANSYPPSETAGLTGEAWLEFLDRPLSGQSFTRGAGRALEEAPYRPRAQIDARALLALSETWIQALPGHPGAGSKR